MASYKCEDLTSCSNFQSAICLHCNRRLCLVHISEHNNIVINSAQNLSTEIEVTFQQIKEEYEKSRNIYNNVLTSFHEWRIKQMEKIDQIYENQLKLIEFQQETLNQVQQNLLEQLVREARQPLERIQSQQITSTEILNHVQQIIKKIREDSVHLKRNFSMPPLINIEYQPSDLPPPPIPKQISNSINVQSMPNQSSASSNNKLHLKVSRPLKRLIQMFANISSIEQSKNNIIHYVRKQGRFFKLPILVCSYLTAWDRRVNPIQKDILLNEYIITIKKYLSNRNNDFDVLIGIQSFFYNEKGQQNEHETMTFLLQFFLTHQCISENQIFNWYNNKDSCGYARRLATPFIKSFTTMNNVNNRSVVSTNQITTDQFGYNHIKDEPVHMSKDIIHHSLPLS